jgi:hypothetical protein
MAGSALQLYCGTGQKILVGGVPTLDHVTVRVVVRARLVEGVVGLAVVTGFTRLVHASVLLCAYCIETYFYQASSRQ